MNFFVSLQNQGNAEGGIILNQKDVFRQKK